MKLRIKGNSIRLRVTRSELADLARHGVVEEAIRFGPGDGQRLGYILRTSADLDELTVRYQPGEIVVLLPRARAQSWWDGEQIGLEGRQLLGDGLTLSILVEKDFACRHEREGEDDGDAFPNPAGRKG